MIIPQMNYNNELVNLSANFNNFFKICTHDFFIFFKCQLSQACNFKVDLIQLQNSSHATSKLIPVTFM